MKCPHCFSDVDPGKFCTNCGKLLEVSTAPAVNPLPAVSDTATVVPLPNPTVKATSVSALKGTALAASPVSPDADISEPVIPTSHSNYKEITAPVPTEIPMTRVPAEKPKTREKRVRRSKLGITLYVLIMVLTVVLGTLLGVWATDNHYPMFSFSSDEESADFHWNNPSDAVRYTLTSEE